MKGQRVKDITQEDVVRSYTFKFCVRHCKRALDSYDKAMSCLKAKQQRNYDDRIRMLHERLAVGKSLSNEHFPKVDGSGRGGDIRQEAVLPKFPGSDATRYFYALKKIPIRGYFWKSDRVIDTYFVSHYIKKDFDDLAENDKIKVRNNWTRIEVNRDEF